MITPAKKAKKRTRRLFTTVNKKAQKISKTATIALDEDNGFAIATRRIIDEHWLFEDNRAHISYASTGSISSSEIHTITSVVGLYELVRDLYPYSAKKRRKFEHTRPSDNDLDEHISDAKAYIDSLLNLCPEYQSAFIDRTNTAQHYREEKGHLLFRPIGQRIFATATSLLISRGNTLEASIQSLLSVELDIREDAWLHILWAPVTETMITKLKVIAETQLLALAGHDARTTQHANKLVQFLENRENTN